MLLPWMLWADAPSTKVWQKQAEQWNAAITNTRLEQVQWSDSGEYVVYAWREAEGRLSYKRVVCATGQVSAAFDPEAIARELRKEIKPKADARSLGLSRVVPLDDGRLWLEGNGFVCALGLDGNLTKQEVGQAPAVRPVAGKNRELGTGRILSASRVAAVSPNRQWQALITKDSVTLTASDGRKVAFTIAGQPGSPALPPGFNWLGQAAWSPDGQHFALWAVRTVAPRKYLIKDSIKQTEAAVDYERPGDDRTERLACVFSVNGGFWYPSTEVLPLAMGVDRLDWSADSSVLRTAYTLRGFTGHGILEFSAAQHTWRRLLVEADPKFVFSYGSFFRYDLDDNETLWTSERSGWLHLYRTNLRTGATVNALTSGAWVLKSILQVDALLRQVTFIGIGRNPQEDPYYRHLYRVNFDGTGLVQLTQGDGTHDVQFAPRRQYFIDTSSRVDLAPSFTLRRTSDGQALALLGQADLQKLRAAGWEAPQRFVAKDRAGKFNIHGIIVRPYPFDPQKKYPVIEHVYAGPQDSFVPKSFAVWNNVFREPSLQGFYVVQVDGRGTWNRGKEFHQEAWRNLADAGFPDRILWLRAAAQAEPQMDLTRVGIFGGSAGGQNAVHALLRHGDFYQAAAADCGCYDNRIDKLWWNEQWMGYPVGPWYATNSCATEATRLQGKLFLTVGEVDSNVDVKCTYDLRDALVAAGKSNLLEFTVVPGANHGASERGDMREKRLDFFQRTLGGPLSR